MTEETSPESFPYNQPMFRTSYSARSPDGKLVAEINPAMEVAMSDPTSGVLRLSNGIRIESCNPSFLWSDDSKYLAVPHWKYKFGLLLGQQIFVVDVAARQVFKSRWYWNVLQPESFHLGLLSVTFRPQWNPKRIEWRIPGDLHLLECSPIQQDAA